MSYEIAISVENLSKCYQIYNQPQDRLKQLVYPQLKRFFGKPSRQYFREFWALKDISFEVKKGESVGILGRNGSGKSTLLQMICGTLSPTQGSIITNGRIAALLELGSGFNPEFSGRENVYMNGALLGLSSREIDDRFDAIASFADIGDFIEQPTKTYSSGMMIRLAFAVQVQVEPDILIVDEALAVGDALFQKRCFQRIEQLVSNGTTLLFVSHDQESIRTLTHRALLLKQGRTTAWGVSSEVVLEYRRQLHTEETTKLTEVTQKLAGKKRVDSFGVKGIAPIQSIKDPQSFFSSRSDRLSFGDGGVVVNDVRIFDADGIECSIFYPGELLTIRITCHVLIDIDHLNVAVRIRNKEGVKIYSWGTLNQDMAILFEKSAREMFWQKKHLAGDEFAVDFKCDTPLGVNLYEVQATVSYEDTPDYFGQRILHWVDEAAFFQVNMRREEYFFGGVVDLRMNAT